MFSIHSLEVDLYSLLLYLSLLPLLYLASLYPLEGFLLYLSSISYLLKF